MILTYGFRNIRLQETNVRIIIFQTMQKTRGISHTSYQSIFKNFHGIAIAYELEIILVSSISVC